MADTIFYNADYLVIEYIDMVKSPYLNLLYRLCKNERIREILKTEDIEHLDYGGLYEWYINRKHQNFLIDLNRYPDKITNEDLDKLLDEQISSSNFFYNEAPPLILVDMLKVVTKRKLVKDVIVYHPHSNNFAEEDLKKYLSSAPIFITDWDEVMDKAGANSTYFISNVDLIQRMKEKEILKCSSITLPVEYRYNKKNMTEFKFDFEELFRENPFKLSYVQACTFNHPDEFID